MSANIGGETVTLHCGDALSALRVQDSVNESSFHKGEFDFSTLVDGGAKGGSKMQFTKNKRFFIKQLSDEDHAQLLNLSKTYVDYIKSNSNSLLIRFYYHFHRKQDEKVMNFHLTGHASPVVTRHPISRNMLS
jgi:hypothetical protein